jgi:hypothetical protein
MQMPFPYQRLCALGMLTLILLNLIALSDADPDSCCFGIYDVIPYSMPSSCPSESFDFPGQSVWIQDCSIVSLTCHIIKCNIQSGGHPVYVSRCVEDESTALYLAAEVTSGMSAGYNCSRLVTPRIQSTASRSSRNAQPMLLGIVLLPAILLITAYI